MAEKTMITLDSNVFNHEEISKIEQTVQGLPITLCYASVTEREFEGTDFRVLGERVEETAVWGEFRWGQSRWGDRETATLLEEILSAMSCGSFPRNRTNLSNGYRRQLRDAMILSAHKQAGGTIFVTNETNAFGHKDDSRRQKLEELCATQIMNLAEFYVYCETKKMAMQENPERGQPT